MDWILWFWNGMPAISPWIVWSESCYLSGLCGVDVIFSQLDRHLCNVWLHWRDCRGDSSLRLALRILLSASWDAFWSFAPVCFNGITPKSPCRTHRARTDKTSVSFHDKNPTGSSSWGVKNLQQFSSSCSHRLWIPTAQKVSACCSRVGWGSGQSFLIDRKHTANGGCFNQVGCLTCSFDLRCCWTF